MLILSESAENNESSDLFTLHTGSYRMLKEKSLKLSIDVQLHSLIV